MYDLLLLGTADIGENKCGTVIAKLVFLITGYSFNILKFGLLLLLPEWINKTVH